MIKLKEVNSQRLRDVRSGKLTDRGDGKTISYLLHILSNLHEFNVGKSYLYVGDTHVGSQLAKEQLILWMNESDICGYQSKTSITAIFSMYFRPGLIGWWDRLTKPLPETEIVIEFMPAESGGGKRGTKLVDEVIIDVSEKTQKAFGAQLCTAEATGKYVYV